MIGRGSFITGLVSLVAAPAIVRAGSLMPVKADKLSPSEFNDMVRRMMVDMAERAVNPPWVPSTAYGYADLIQYQDGYLKVVPTWILDDLR